VHREAEPLTGRVYSVNVAEPTVLQTAHGLVPSGIHKLPVTGPVMLRTLNFDGDRQADLTVHGGPDKAAYCYAHEHYAWWAAELGRAAGEPGWFGENLTLTGLLEGAVRLGDVYRVGSARVQVSQPRTPCFKLAAKMGVRGFERRFMLSGRSGWYVRVLAEGLIAAGDALVQESVGEGPSIAQSLARRWS